MPKKRQGKIIPNGVLLRTHEFNTVVFLTECGFDVEFIPPKQAQGSKTPDIKMNGLKWEMKSPTKNGKHTLDRAMKAGLKQSDNLIFDLRRISNTGKKATLKLQKDFATTKKWRRLIIITKEKKLLTLAK
jgi:hypothetical protein